MWENTQRKRIIINIFLALLIVVVLGVLGFFLLQVRATNQAHDEELSEIYVQQQRQQSEARQENLSSIDDAYAEQMQIVAKYIPGIVCWGDNTTAAVSGMLNYPYVLQTYINTYLCDIYDFSSTIDNALDYTRLDWKKYKLSIPVVNMASGKESSYTILGRAGVDPYTLYSEVTIPADTTPVTVELTNAEGMIVTPLTGGDIGVNNVVLGGIEGRLALNAEETTYNGFMNYTFTRLTPGSEVVVPAGSVLKTASEELYKNYIHVVLIGMYGEYKTADELVQQVKTLLSRQAQNPERFIVLGPYSHNIYAASTSAMDEVDSAMVSAFGNRYISIRRYLIGDGYTDAGISPTREDEYYITQEIVPPSFKVASHSEELNSLAHKLIGKMIYTRMDSLGYFDEIKQELNLTETTKEIIKDNPSYFESIIKNVLK